MLTIWPNQEYFADKNFKYRTTSTCDDGNYCIRITIQKELRGEIFTIKTHTEITAKIKIKRQLCIIRISNVEINSKFNKRK